MQPPKLINMFAVPFSFGRYPTPELLNPALKGYVLTLEKAGAANPRPLTQRNHATFESHFNLFRDANPAIQELKRFCWDQMLTMIGQLNRYDQQTLNRLQIYNDCWFHITRRGGFFGVHIHPNASWSGVYCVDPGQRDAGKKDSGLLSFINPMMSNAMHVDAGNVGLQLPYSAEIAHVALEAGQLVMFPSWVPHDVKPFEGEGERITIAFNCWFSLPDPVPQAS
jgi:uncharacterized protein (TIGR02466 family)